jgi:anti-sigma B factor antagonist
VTRHVDLETLEGFKIGVSYAGPGVVVVVQGEVDLSTATELGGIVNAVIDGGNRRVVLDLARCTFFDASGLEVMAAAARRLSLPPLSRAFAVRAPSTMVRRIMVVTGLDKVVTIEQSPPATHLGWEQGGCGRATRTRIGAHPKVQSPRQVTAIPAYRDAADGEGAYAFHRDLSRTSDRPIRELADEIVAATLGPQPSGTKTAVMNVD